MFHTPVYIRLALVSWLGQDKSQFRADTTQVAYNFHFRINSKDMGVCKIILSNIMDEVSRILEYLF